MPKKRKLNVAYISTPIILLIFFFAWKLYIDAFSIPRQILPAPEGVVARLIDLMGRASTWQHIQVTLTEILLGFALGSAIGILVGFIVGKSPLLEQMLNPFIVATQVVPKVALVPLFVLWFGFGPTSKIVIAALLSFFPLLSNVVLAVKSVEENKRDLMQSLAADPWQVFVKLELPFSLPYILTGMEVGIVLSVIGAVVGEYLGGDRGLGYLAVYSLSVFNVEQLFAVIILLTVIGFLLYAIMGAIRRYIIPWHESVMGIREVQ